MGVYLLIWENKPKFKNFYIKKYKYNTYFKIYKQIKKIKKNYNILYKGIARHWMEINRPVKGRAEFNGKACLTERPKSRTDT
jgi:hypothetical protein